MGRKTAGRFPESISILLAKEHSTKWTAIECATILCRKVGGKLPVDFHWSIDAMNKVYRMRYVSVKTEKRSYSNDDENVYVILLNASPNNDWAWHEVNIGGYISQSYSPHIDLKSGRFQHQNHYIMKCQNYLRSGSPSLLPGCKE